MAAIWEVLVFLDKEAGEVLQRLVFDRAYSVLFACADTNDLYKLFVSILIKDRHAKAEEAEDPKEAEEGAGKEGA
jgi:hypothetical protein